MTQSATPNLLGHLVVAYATLQYVFDGELARGTATREMLADLDDRGEGLMRGLRQRGKASDLLLADAIAQRTQETAHLLEQLPSRPKPY